MPLRPRTALAALLAAPAVPAAAQSPVTIGVAAGASSLPPAGGADPRTGRYHSQLALGVAPRGWPLELRADLFWVHWPSYAGPVSASANALLPFASAPLGPGAVLRPYVLAGGGVYGVGTGAHSLGANAGAGTRIEFGRVATFVEARRHTAYRRTFATVGITLRP